MPPHRFRIEIRPARNGSRLRTRRGRFVAAVRDAESGYPIYCVSRPTEARALRAAEVWCKSQGARPTPATAARILMQRCLKCESPIPPERQGLFHSSGTARFWAFYCAYCERFWVVRTGPRGASRPRWATEVEADLARRALFTRAGVPVPTR